MLRPARLVLLTLLVVGSSVVVPLGANASVDTAVPATERGQSASVNESRHVSVIVTFERRADVRGSAISAVGGTVTGGTDLQVLPVLFADVPRESVSRLRTRPTVVAVTRDRSRQFVDERRLAIGETFDASNSLSNQTGTQSVPWGVARINGTEAAGRVGERGISAVDVAVVDSGIDPSHPDLDNVAWGVNTVGPGLEYGLAAAADDNGHGTHVAGTIAARDNDQGVVGAAPNATLYSIKVVDSNGSGWLSDLIQGLDAAIVGPDGTLGTVDDAEVVSVSLGTDLDDSGLADAIDAAATEATIVASAGNDGDGDPSTDEVLYPARYDGAMAVGATDTTDTVLPWSSSGTDIAVAAPGSRIPSTAVTGGYATLSGTSMATPHVAGVATLIWARDFADGSREFEPTAVRERIEATALDIGSDGVDTLSGYGRVRADTALPRSVQVSLSANRTTVQTGGSVSFSVTDARTVEPENATLTVGDTTLVTGEAGTASVRFPERGNYTVTATRSDTVRAVYTSDSVDVRVSDPSNVTVGYAVNRTRVAPGAPIGVNVTATNSGDSPGTASLTLYTNGQPTASRNRTVRGGNTATTEFVTSLSTPGRYELTVNEQPSTFVSVTNASTDGPVLVGSATAADGNGDGKYEDVNGDGAFDIVDVSAFLIHYRSVRDDVEHTEKFDFNSNGAVDIVDVSRLFKIYDASRR
jgi:subtilisin family serine protease